MARNQLGAVKHEMIAMNGSGPAKLDSRILQPAICYDTRAPECATTSTTTQTAQSHGLQKSCRKKRKLDSFSCCTKK